MTWVTESSTVLAEAPVYVAEILTVGGAMSGYCSRGQLADGQAAAEHDHDGDDPGENRSINEKVRHVQPSFTGVDGVAA